MLSNNMFMVHPKILLTKMTEMSRINEHGDDDDDDDSVRCNLSDSVTEC